MQLCAACRRHVKASPCPFCGEPTQLPTRGVPERAQGLSRTQLLAASAALLATACGAKQNPGPAPIYGGPPDLVDTVDDAGAAEPPTDEAGAPHAAIPAPPPTAQSLYGSPPD